MNAPLTPTLTGHPARNHVLSSDGVSRNLPAAMRAVFGNTAKDERDLWERETQTLPRELAKLRRRARDFAERELAPLALEIDSLGHWPVGTQPAALDELLLKAGAGGWLSDILPKPIGSSSPLLATQPLSMPASIKIEEFARVCGGQMLLLSANMLGQVPLFLSANPGLIKRRLVPGVRANLFGDPYLFAYAITEPHAGSDVEDGHGAQRSKPGVVAKRVTGGWSLNGRKVFISGGDLARGYCVFAGLEGEGYESWTCFFVERGTPGFSQVRTELKMGMRASGAAELEFVDVFVPDEDVVGKLRGGWALNRQTLNLSRIPVGAMAVGFAQAACDIAIDYARTTQFGGRPLIHEQYVQLALADMMTQTSTIRAHLWAVAGKWRLRQHAGAMVKFSTSDGAMQVIEQAMDLLGPGSLLHQNRLEKVWRDCRLTQIFEGTNQINRLSVIEDLQHQFLTSHPSRSASL